MPPVRKLPEELIRHIAAGEVVERPASALKELIENSLDAGARRIVVSWEDAGRKSLRVADDGCGMSPEDARLALERHATSKISALDDLSAIGTFGFRGEALPSLSAVSRFQLVTRAAQAGEAWSIQIEGGKVLREGPAGAPGGTTVLMEDLFFNTPARLKFLKSEPTEKALLLRVVEDAAFSARGVAFQVHSNKREVLNLRAAPAGMASVDALRERLGEAWGADKAASLKPVSAEGKFMTVWGLLSDLHAHQPTARLQRFYINGRPVTHRRLTHALYDAYKGRLFTGRHPAAALFLEVNPALVDVNVHPAKREVRLSNEGEMHDFLSRALQDALAGAVRMPSAFQAPATPPSFYPPPAAGARPSWAESRAAYEVQSPPPGATAALLPALEVKSEGDAPLPLGLFREAFIEPLAQFENTYILARHADAFLIFDQHAAAERALYERLRDAAEGGEPVRQALLLPWVWEVSPEAAALIQGRLEDFRRLGYDLEPFGSQAYRVKAVPGLLGDSARVKELLEGLVGDMLADKIPRDWDALLVRTACRGSVRAGDVLQAPQMKQVIKDLQSCRSPWSCPHGRPTFLRLDPADLSRRFRRT
jgi:DNA mismatch repair protein MutL